MPKLLYVLQFYHNRGGVEEHVRALAEGLAKDFHIRIVAPEDGNLVVVENETTVASYPAERDVWPITPYKLPLLEQGLAAALADFRPDLIHVQHMFNWHVGVLDQLTATGVPVIMSFHDYHVITPFYTMQGAPNPAVALSDEYCKLTFRADITDYVNKRFRLIGDSLARCRAFICPSPYLVNTLGSVLPYPFRAIEHGIHPFTPKAAAKGTERRFGCIGSKLPQKGWVELLKAFQILRTQEPEVELIFFGGGQKAPPQASPGVKFAGAYSKENLPEIMAEFAIGVIPSLFAETFSYTLSELWAGGKPVAVSRIGSLGERVTDGVNGRLFQPGDIPSMVETMRWFLQSDEWKSWKLPVPRHVDEMINDYRALYRSFLETSGGG